MKGKIESTRKDNTGFKIDGDWITNKYLDDKEKDKISKLNRGDTVEYEVNSKGYLSKVKINKENKLKNPKERMFKLSYAKDLAVAIIEKGNSNGQEVETILNECVDAIKKAEKKLD